MQRITDHDSRTEAWRQKWLRAHFLNHKQEADNAFKMAEGFRNLKAPTSDILPLARPRHKQPTNSHPMGIKHSNTRDLWEISQTNHHTLRPGLPVGRQGCVYFSISSINLKIMPPGSEAEFFMLGSLVRPGPP